MKMSGKNRTTATFAPRERETLIATARRNRRQTMRNLIGAMFGR
jgi:hypothetical protein